MAILKAFKGLRPPKDLADKVASRPYDVLNSDEAREEAKEMNTLCSTLLNPKSTSLRKLMYTHQRSMKKPERTSLCSRKKDG